MSVASKRSFYIFLLSVLNEVKYLYSSSGENLDTLDQSKFGRTGHEAKSNLQPECGLSNFTLDPTASLEEISGGECTNEHAFPWIVRLYG